jgi:translation initiation factor 2B subunit (eIF-2B alpha/beta/delta family)
MDELRATLSAIAADRESGAAQIARAAAKALRAVKPPDLHAAIRLLVEGHPAMAPLWRLATDVLTASDPARGADDFLRRLDSDGLAALLLAPQLPRTVLTISFSSSVIEVVRNGPVDLLLCMRSEPGGEGERMAMAARPTPARVIEDDEAIARVPAEVVVVGADAVTPFGLINKAKTGALAEAARSRGVSCYVVAGDSKFVEAELSLVAPFEHVSLDLFTAIATPAGLVSPGEAGELAKRARLHPDLVPLLIEVSGPKH